MKLADGLFVVERVKNTLQDCAEMEEALKKLKSERRE